MAMRYERPIAVAAEGMSEGVFLASGAGEQEGKIACQSKYMKGVWKKPDPRENYTQQIAAWRKGCEGCSADDGDGCKIAKGKGEDLNPYGVFKPTWEQQGKGPDDLVW